MKIPHLLLVEDEIGIAGFITQGLNEENMQVTHCFSGEEALGCIQEHRFDVILLDWTLMDISGLEVCKTIRATENINKNAPIIFITAKDTVQDTITGLQAGANDYIKKPFDFNELVARIQVYLRNSLSDSLFQLGDIVLDGATHQVFLHHQKVEVTLKEFQLIYYLFTHKNNVCTRKEILEQVWDIHFDYDSSVIDVFVNSIRKKLQLNKEDPRLKTIRGVGYMSSDV